MTNGNDTIFPAPLGLNYTSGLTVREHFAAMAMQGHLANIETLRALSQDKSPNGLFELTAKAAVEMADALIEALNKEAK